MAFWSHHLVFLLISVFALYTGRREREIIIIIRRMVTIVKKKKKKRITR